MFSKGVEAAIRDGLERGDFDQLPGAGKPIDLSAYFETPEDLRLAYGMLKSAARVPQEVDLMQQINELEEQARQVSSKAGVQPAARRLRLCD